MVWPSGCVCHAVRAAGMKWTMAAATRVGGRGECEAAWHAFSARAMTDPRAGAQRDLAFDAYCMQHPATYCRSAKSYAAHLMRLACGVEHDGARTVYDAIRRWLDGHVQLEKPPVPEHRGEI